jgi:hypothetical protein
VGKGIRLRWGDAETRAQILVVVSRPGWLGSGFALDGTSYELAVGDLWAEARYHWHSSMSTSWRSLHEGATAWMEGMEKFEFHEPEPEG